MLQIKNTETKMKNAFDRPISRLTDDMAKERISEFEDISKETFQTEKQREQYFVVWDNYKKCNIHIMEIPEGEEREKGREEIVEIIMIENFSN